MSEGDTKTRDESVPPQNSETTCILDLPTELLEHIATYVSHSDLPALRLASRMINACVQDIFSKAMFSDRGFLLSDRSSMNVLYEISRHKTFAKELQYIFFSQVVLLSRKYFEHCWHKFAAIATKPERESNNHVKQLHRNLKDDEELFVGNNDETETLNTMLRHVFFNFNYLNHYPKISFLERWADGSNSNHATHPPWGLRRLRKTLRADLLVCDVVINAGHSTYQERVYKAMAEYHYEPEELQIDQSAFEMRLSSNSQLRSHSLTASLHTLRLMLDIGYHTNHEDGPTSISSTPSRRRDIEDFVLFIASAPRLKILFLRTHQQCFDVDTTCHSGGSIYSDVFHCLARKCHMNGSPLNPSNESILLPNLQAIHMANFRVKFDLLLKFCSDRRDTLRTINLDRIVDDEYRDPLDVEQSIRRVLLQGSGTDASVVNLRLVGSFKGVSSRGIGLR